MLQQIFSFSALWLVVDLAELSEYWNNRESDKKKSCLVFSCALVINIFHQRGTQILLADEENTSWYENQTHKVMLSGQSAHEDTH